MGRDGLSVGQVRSLMRHAALGQRPGSTRFDHPEVTFARGRTQPVSADDLPAAIQAARQHQDQWLNILENEAQAVLAEIASQRNQWQQLGASGHCLCQELLTIVQDQDPGAGVGGKLFEEEG